MDMVENWSPPSPPLGGGGTSWQLLRSICKEFKEKWPGIRTIEAVNEDTDNWTQPQLGMTS
jgi:hypothetical protein